MKESRVVLEVAKTAKQSGDISATQREGSFAEKGEVNHG